MVYVCLALVAALAATVVSFTGLLRSEKRASARREDLLLDKMLHSVGRPWTPAPADELRLEPELQTRTWSWSPEQLPVDDIVDREVAV